MDRNCPALRLIEVWPWQYLDQKMRNGCGIALIALGLIAIPIPIIPGFPLIAAGAAMLGPKHRLVRYGRNWLKNRGFLKSQ